MLEELGPTFIKLGQFLSSRSDIVPLYVIDALKQLQEKVTPVAFERIQELIIQNIPDYEEIFDCIEATPLGVASIAQTHVARLKDGRQVVMKIRKPDVMNQIELDLGVLQKVVNFLSEQPEVNKFMDLENSFAIFAHSLRKETDFLTEAGNIELFSNLLANSGLARTPKVEWRLTNENIVTMEYIENFIAIQNTDVEALMNVAIDMGHVARELNWQSYYEDMAELVFVSQNMAQGKMEMGKIIFGMMQISQKHGIRMPERLLLLGKAFTIAEGNARKIDPNVNFLEIARPITEEFLKESVLSSLNEMTILANILDVKKKLRIVFNEVPAFISGVARGEKKIPLYISGIDFIGEKLDKSINRISYSLIIASMLLTSAIMMHSGEGPIQGQIHYTGYYLLLVSLVATVYLFFKMFRQVKK